jgi:hypothetical protein
VVTSVTSGQCVRKSIAHDGMRKQVFDAGDFLLTGGSSDCQVYKCIELHALLSLVRNWSVVQAIVFLLFDVALLQCTAKEIVFRDRQSILTVKYIVSVLPLLLTVFTLESKCQSLKKVEKLMS